MKRLLVPLMAGSLLVGAILNSQAATFAQFLGQTGAENVLFTGGSTGNLTTVAGGDPVFFQFKSQSGFAIAAPLDTDIRAILTFTDAQANGLPAQTPGGNPTQPFRSGSFEIRSQTNQTINGVNFTAGQLLLSGVNSLVNPPVAAVLTGSGGSATFRAPLQGFPNAIVYSSPFIDFTNATGNAYAFSLTLTNPPGITTSGSGLTLAINPFSAAATGTFTSNAVPEPGSFALLAGLGVCGSLFAFRNRARRGTKRTTRV